MEMTMKTRGGDYVAYEYMDVATTGNYGSMYLDGYFSFGWVPDGNVPQGKASLRLKRDRRIMNKAELTRLQRHFESCMDEIRNLEKSKTTIATIAAIVVGIIGTAFMAGAVFAVTAAAPIMWLMVLLAVPGFAGWIAPNFIYKSLLRRDAKKMEPLIEAKYEEIYDVCEKGHKLLDE